MKDLGDELDNLCLEEETMKMHVAIKRKQESIARMRQLLSQGSEPGQDDKGSSFPLFPGQVDKFDRGGPDKSYRQRDTTSFLPRLDMDPQVYLKSDPTKCKSKTYKKIIDFLPRHGQDEEYSLVEGVTIKVGNGSKRKLDQVTPTQWIAANSKILAEFIEEGMDTNGTLDYLSYTTKIGELGSRFTWVSVVNFDDEYRRNQSQMGYRWGSDSQHLSTVLLREREHKNNGNKTNYSATNRKESNAETQYCGYYNFGRDCPYGNKCIYQHACNQCGKNHRKIDHNKGESDQIDKKVGKPE